MTPSYRLKLHRALEHLYALHAAEQRWTERDACVIVEECELKTRKHVVRLRVFEQPGDPTLRLLTGDVVHALRHSLDHLAYRLAVKIASADPPPNDTTTQFPITSSRAKFDGRLAEKVGPKKRMPSGMYAALEGFQPYKGGNRELLGALHQLDNLDKHRFPPLVSGVAQIGGMHIGHVHASHFVGPRLGALEDDAVILEYIPLPDTNVSMQLQFAGAVAFDQRSTVAAGQPVIPFLASIRNLIRDEVFPTLEPFT